MQASGQHPSGIFLSYRRGEASGYAGRLYDHLSSEFGDNQVFMDVDSIQLGMDFPEALDRAVESCVVMLVLIGPRWAEVRNTGSPRLDDPNDYVRIEVQTALKRGIRVVPLLIGGADLPASTELPDAIQPLVRRQALELKDATFRSDLTLLIRRLHGVVPGASDSATEGVLGARAAVLDSLQYLRGRKNAYLSPEIPRDNLETARRAAKVPSDEEILVLLESPRRLKKSILLFGVGGMYGYTFVYVPTTSSLSYNQFRAEDEIHLDAPYGGYGFALNIGKHGRHSFGLEGLKSVGLDELLVAVKQLKGRLT